MIRFFLLSLSIFFLIDCTSSVSQSFADTINRVLASIDNNLITYSDYLKFTGETQDKNSEMKIDEKILKNLIEEKIMLEEAEKSMIEVNEKEIEEAVQDFMIQHKLSPDTLKLQIKQEGLDNIGFLKIMKEKIMVSKLINMQIDSKIFITEDEKISYYNKNRNNYIYIPEKVEAKAVFLKLKESSTLTELTDLKRKALKVTKLLRDGEPFEVVLEKYSDEPLKSQNGFLGVFEKGKMIPQLDAVAFSMKKGEVSDPIWVQDGAYILYIVSKSREVYKPYEWVKDDINNLIYAEKKDKLYNEWIKKLWEKHAVKINLN
ncbi:MAG: peptidylprolyl isomerase [Nitrospirae bacterium]|nr:peptidylprolyl isomerase [Nitrospirota bacterium]